MSATAVINTAVQCVNLKVCFNVAVGSGTHCDHIIVLESIPRVLLATFGESCVFYKSRTNDQTNQCAIQPKTPF